MQNRVRFYEIIKNQCLSELSLKQNSFDPVVEIEKIVNLKLQNIVLENQEFKEAWQLSLESDLMKYYEKTLKYNNKFCQ